MLPLVNTLVKRRQVTADAHPMERGIAPATPGESPAGFSDVATAPGALAMIAHELNALLDGSMRRIRLARTTLPSNAPGADVQAVCEHLHVAETSLQRMTELLAQACDPARPDSIALSLAPSRLFSSCAPLDRTVAEIVACLKPRADEAGIALSVVVEPGLENVPTSALAAVLHSGLRSAIEAAATAPQDQRRVEMVVLRRNGHLLLDIIDSGPAVADVAFADDGAPASTDRADERAAATTGANDFGESAHTATGLSDADGGTCDRQPGHDVGLNFSRLIVEELGGTLTMSRVPFGGGAILEVRVPITRLMR